MTCKNLFSILLVLFASFLYSQERKSDFSLSIKVGSEIPDSLLTLNIEELTVFSESADFQINKKLLELENLRSLSILVDGHAYTLPSWIGDLKQIEELYVKWNLKDIPKELYQLEGLKALSLIGFYTEIPEGIERLSSLEYLNLSSKELKKVPQGIFELSSLAYLGITGTQIESIPNTINNLSKLEFLDLGNNKLSDCPLISNCTKLEEINLHENRLSPFQVDALLTNEIKARLKYNYNFQKFQNNAMYSALGSNKENTCDRVKKALRKDEIRVLDLSDHKNLEKELTLIKENADQLKHIEVIKLGNNSLKAFPLEVLELVNLKEIYLNDNGLFTLPKEFYDYDGVRILDISHNEFPMLERELLKMHQLSQLIVDQALVNEYMLSSLNRFLPRCDIKKIP